MPIGVICMCSAALIGGLVGGKIRYHFPERLKDPMIVVFGMCAVGIGIISLLRVSSMPAVVLAVVTGMLVGEFFDLEKIIKTFFLKIILKMKFKIDGDYDKYMSFYVIVVTIFCASGANIFGAITEGMTGDMSVLVSKAAMDLFAALIFAATLGYAFCIIVAPQALVLLACFYGGRLIVPFVTDTMMMDFAATGGFLTICLGIAAAKIKDIKAINMLPALIFIFPLSWMFSRLAFWIG